MTDKEVREKLVTRGAESLTDAELLSVILQEGTLGAGSSVVVAERILKNPEYSLTALSKMDIKRLRMIESMGVKRAALLSAALELGRRLACEKPDAPVTIRTNDDVLRIFHPQLSGLDYEEFWVLYLTSAGRIIDRGRASQGGVSGTVVDYRLIVKRAIELLASSLILVHNHPSGCASPSEEDFQVTEKIVKAAALFDIRVMDHIIISSESHFSFLQKGLMPDPNDD